MAVIKLREAFEGINPKNLDINCAMDTQQLFWFQFEVEKIEWVRFSMDIIQKYFTIRTYEACEVS